MLCTTITAASAATIVRMTWKPEYAGNHSLVLTASSLCKDRGVQRQGCSGAGTRWNAVPANIVEPERLSGKYRWPPMER